MASNNFLYPPNKILIVIIGSKSIMTAFKRSILKFAIEPRESSTCKEKGVAV